MLESVDRGLPIELRVAVAGLLHIRRLPIEGLSVERLPIRHLPIHHIPVELLSVRRLCALHHRDALGALHHRIELRALHALYTLHALRALHSKPRIRIILEIRGCLLGWLLILRHRLLPIHAVRLDARNALLVLGHGRLHVLHLSLGTLHLRGHSLHIIWKALRRILPILLSEIRHAYLIRLPLRGTCRAH